MIRRFRIQQQKIELNHYEGSLDFPCDFCGNSSYNNFQISKDGQLEFVFCQECLEKVYNVISTNSALNSPQTKHPDSTADMSFKNIEDDKTGDIHSQNKELLDKDYIGMWNAEDTPEAKFFAKDKQGVR